MKISSLKNGGQGLVETIIFLHLIVTALSLLIVGLSWTYFYFTVHFLMDEALICKTTLHAKDCEQQFQKRLDQFSPFVRYKRINFVQNKHRCRAHLEVELPFHFLWKMDRQIK